MYAQNKHYAFREKQCRGKIERSIGREYEKLHGNTITRIQKSARPVIGCIITITKKRKAKDLRSNAIKYLKKMLEGK
jgi:hypothetical protein